jgi:ketosteroid isomerase-like protein
MRNKNIFYFLLLASLAAAACQQKTDVAAEKEAIKAINQKELEACENFNYEGEAEIWLHEPYIVHTRAKIDSGVKGWEALSRHYKDLYSRLKQDPNSEVEFTAENFDIQIEGDNAFLMYDETMEGVLNGQKYSHEKRVYKYFLKKDGEWKLLAVY